MIPADFRGNISAELKDKIKALAKETYSFCEDIGGTRMFSEHGFLTDGAELSICPVSDEGDMLCDRFLASPATERLSKKLSFRRISIDQSLTEFSEPLVILCDSSEPDVYTCGHMRERSEHGFRSYPVILFPNEFFKLLEGEKSSYIDICDIVADCTQAAVMPLTYSDLESGSSFVDGFAEYISCSCRLEAITELIEKAEQLLAQETKKPVFGNAFERLGKLARQKAAVKLCLRLRDKRAKALSLAERWGSTLASMRAEYDKHILEVVTRRHIANIGDIEVRLKLKYNTNAGEIVAFADMVTERLKGCALVNDPAALRNSTKKRMESEALDLAFIGTFSSGKTTLINSLLGIAHKLPTSASHNTAVLTYISAAHGGNSYSIERSEKLVWSLVTYLSFEKPVTNPFADKAKVIKITKAAGEYRVTLRQLDQPHGECTVTVNSTHKLCCTEGSVLSGGESMTKVSKSEDKVRVCSLDELDYIQKLISENKAVGLQLNYKPATPKEVLRIINALRSFYSNRTRVNPHSSAAVKAGELLDGYIDESYLRCIFSCELKGLPEVSVKLDSEQKWTELCGDSDKKITALCEKPECYMTARQLDLRLDSGFLRYSTLVDTPGFGSVTEEHDNITERFIRDSANHLVVMISIGIQAEDTKFKDLINNLSGIYSSFKNGQQKNVRFILNCFVKTAGRAHCEKKALEICRLLVSKGFFMDNIYACDLKRAIIENAPDEAIAGLGTYAQFKQRCLEELPITALREKYLGIKRDWEHFFAQNLQNVENSVYSIETDMERSEEAARRLMLRLRNVGDVTMESVERFISEVRGEFDDIYSSLESAFRNNRQHTFLFWGNKRWDKLTDLLDGSVKDQIALWAESEKDITAWYEEAMEELISASGETMDYKLPKKPWQSLIVLSFDTIKHLLSEADDEIFSSHIQTDKLRTHMARLRNQLDTDFSTSESHIRTYYGLLKNEFEALKKTIIAQLKARLDATESVQAMQNERDRLKALRNTLRELECGFKRISFDI